MKNKSIGKNIKKKLLSVIGYFLLTIVILPFVLMVLFHNPIVQTITGKMVASILSKTMDQKVTLKLVNISLFKGVTIEGLNIYDHHDSSMLYVGRLYAKPVFTNFSVTNLKFYSIDIDSVRFKMISYKGDDSDNLSLMINKLSPDSTSVGGSGFSISSGKIMLNNSAFTYNNRNRNYETGPRNMDYANIVFDSINMDLHNFLLINDSLNFHVNKLAAREKSGMVIHNMSTDFTISQNCLLTDNSTIHMNNSSMDGDFGMYYHGYSSMSSFIDSVQMYADINPTTINMADLGIFSDVLYSMPNVVGVTGKMNGTVRDLTATDFRIKFAENTRLSGNISFKGLPDFYTSKIVADSLRIITNTLDISKFYLPIEEKKFDFTDIFPSNKNLVLVGDFDGYYENFKSNIDLQTDDGNISSQIDFCNADSNLLDVKLKVQSDSLNIGSLLGQNYLGQVKMNVDASISGNYPNNIAYTLSGYFRDVDLLDYNYSRVSINADYNGDSAHAEFRVGDRNLMMSGKASAFLGSIPVFNLNADINSAKLHALGFWMDDYIDIKSRINAYVAGSDVNYMDADIKLRNITARFDVDNVYSIDSVVVKKNTDSINTYISVASDIVDASVNGEYLVMDFYDNVLHLVNKYFKVDGANDSLASGNRNAEILVDLKKPKILTKEFLMGVEFNKDSKLKADFDFQNSKVNMQFKTDKIQIYDTRIDSVNVMVSTLSDAIETEFLLQNIILKDSTPDDSLVFGIDDMSASAIIRNDSVVFGLNWDNRIPELKNSGIVEGYYSMSEDSTMFSIDKAEVFVNDLFWTIDTNNLIAKYNGRTYFHDLRVSAGKSAFEILGTIPKDDNDSLVAIFTDWDLSNFDLLTRRYYVDLDGSIVGELHLGMVNSNPTFVSNIQILDLGLNGEYLGDAHVLNTWDNTNNSVFVKSQIVRKGEVGKGEVFLADGYYYPFKKENNLDINVSFNRFKLHTLEPFLSSIVDELEGTTSGKFAISGSTDNPVIIGSAEMQRAGMKVVYLNTRYSFTNSIDFEKNKIKFDKLVIYDTLGNKANINGSLTHNYFKNPRFDISITTPKLLFFNTKSNMNDLFYGTAIASGDIKFTGSPDDMDLKISTRTLKGTTVTLPLNYSVEISDKDYIIFTNPSQDTLPEKKVLEISERHRKKELAYNIDVNMSVNPDAQVSIDLPSDMGTIQARGNSNLNMDVNSNGMFTMVGDYVVSDGLFHFKIGNLVSKRFSLVNGGRISWSGNPYTANVNIKGLYKVKTNLSSLGITIDSTASYKNKVNVDCYVVLTGELLNPNIKFEIKIPELDPDLQRVVFSELDTTNTAMMNQQMISLLVLGTFSFNNASNVSLQSSYYNVIANQLSSMLSQISENVDIGLNYKPGDDVSEQEFEVALSTQLFDDRLTIDGNFGMTYDRTQQSASNIVGDVDIGYKLTPDGQWVLKVFNHSNVNSWYNYSNYDQISPYTQGVGIAFRKEFNSVRELFMGKKKRKQNKEAQKNKNENKIVPNTENVKTEEKQ